MRRRAQLVGSAEVGNPAAMREPAHLDAVDFLMRAPAYDDAQLLEDHFTRVLSGLGVERYFCSRFEGDVLKKPPVVLVGHGTERWDSYMVEQGYAENNPCRRWSASGRRAFTWREVQDDSRRRGEMPAMERALWAEAAENDMRDGLTITTPGPAGEVLLMRMMTGENRIRDADRPVLESLAIVFSTLRFRLYERSMDEPLNAVLSRREAECLRWAAQGLHDYAIADRMGISANTVGNHMQNALRKLGAPSRLSAYYKALSLGALD